ncbi:MAG: hypothetical protein WC714_18345 [Candidatus Obscuribacterales bacterium]|jgi:hypothetical protein
MCKSSGLCASVDLYIVLALLTVISIFAAYLFFQAKTLVRAHRGVESLELTLKFLRRRAIQPEFKNYKELTDLISRVDIASTEAREFLKRNDYRSTEKIIAEISVELAKHTELLTS